MTNMKQNDCLQTPQYIIDALGVKFDLDPCAGENTNIGNVNLWDGRGENGLEVEWYGTAFVNPPFSQKELWIDKVIDHANKGKPAILLLPERGSAPWFGKLATACDKYFVMGKKINFVGGPSSNNVGSVLFIFGEDALRRVKESGLPGHLVNVEYFTPRI